MQTTAESHTHSTNRPTPGPWIVAVPTFFVVFIVAHQRLHTGHEPAAWPMLAGSVLVWAGVLPWLFLWWLAAAGFGNALQSLLFRKQNTSHLALPLGGAALMGLTWITQWAIGLSQLSMFALLALGLALFAYAHAPAARSLLKSGQLHAPAIPWTAALAAAPLALLAVAVTLPAGTLWRVEAFGYDVLSYHLNIPRQWLDAGGMVALPHDVYAYLPNLVEATFGLFFALRGSASAESVYMAQGFHASWALLAAAQVGRGVFDLTQNRAASWACAAALLAVPWVLITGSMAYNEMVVLALAAAAWRIVMFPHETLRPRARGAGVGLLVGTATLAKLTAGFFVALPLGLALLLGFAHRAARQKIKASVIAACVAGLVGVAVLSPFFLRNASWTGNPVFPFATNILGQGHWDDALVQRWNTGHGLASHDGFDATALARQWFFNTGYGALGGNPTPAESQNIARFDREYGVPLLWLLALTGLLAAARHPRWRRPGAALLAWLALQLIAWHLVTHLQSRFLVTTLVPGVMLAGFAFAKSDQALRNRTPLRRMLLPTGLIASLFFVSLTTFWQQTYPTRDTQTDESKPLPPWFLADAFASKEHPFHPARHPLNTLPRNSRTLIVADTSRLFYYARPIVYASAFDACPLGKIIEEANGEPSRVVAMLNSQGVTHLWVGWSELHRLHSTYGHDARVTEDGLRTLLQGWPVVADLGGSTLFAVPKPGK